MFQFESNEYGDRVADLLAGERLCELGPGRPNRALESQLRSLVAADIAKPAGDQQMALCCLAGLWLWHDFLDESHEISQDIGNSTGSYWHGIMHRREPDYPNAKYWFRRVGDHQIFPELCAVATEMAASEELVGPAAKFAQADAWDPYAFVDLCESAASGKHDCESFCRNVARAEWQLLFDHCYRLAQ